MAALCLAACTSVSPPPPGKEPATGEQRLARDYQNSRDAKMARFCLDRVRIHRSKDPSVAERLARELQQSNAWARRHGAKGMRMEKKGDLKRARLEYLMALNYNPRHLKSLQHLAAMLAKQGGRPYRTQWNDSSFLLARRIYYDSERGLLLGELWGYGLKDRIPENTRLKLPNLDPGAPGVWDRGERMMDIARTQLEAGRYVHALNLAKQAIRQRPRSMEIAWMLNTSRYLMGLQYMRLKRFNKSVEFLKAVDPKFFDTKSALEEMHRRRLRLARVHTKRGLGLLDQGEYKKALRQFEMALEFNPRNRVAIQGKKKAEGRLGK